MILEAKIEREFMLVNSGEIRFILIRRGLSIQRFEEVMFNALNKENENLQNYRYERNSKFPKIIR
jgi:hypothetical protein